MSKWITSDVVSAVSAIPEVKISNVTQGEDYTTQTIHITVDDSQNNVYVRGFVTSGKALHTDDNVDIEMVEVATCFSDGDMPADPVYVVANAKVKAEIMKLGHTVVNSMDSYF